MCSSWLTASEFSRAQRLAAIRDEHQHLAAILGVLHAVDQGIRHHAVDHLGQRRMVEQHGIREFAHRMTVAVGQHFQDAPLLDRHTFLGSRVSNCRLISRLACASR